MAEVIGVVAASLEFGKVFVELKTKASSIRHAPEELIVVLEELEVTDAILQALADQDALLSIYAPPNVIQKCRDFCKNATDILKPVCLELSETIKQSRWPGSIKFVLKEHFLERATRRIERAKMNLILAQSAASIAMSALSLQQQMTTQTLIITKSDVKTDKAALQAHGRSKLSVMADPQADDADISRGDDDGADEQGLVITKTQRKLAGPLRGAKKTTTSVLTIQSMWLGKRLQILRMRTSGITYFGIKTRNIIPYDSPIFAAVCAGDFCATRDLLHTKQASIYDVDLAGNTVLHVWYFECSELQADIERS
ncbi:hypothetical protein H2204_000198 [Knufia peltigerae]|uniref:Fungal N-terminal domain-containing protein n=1 Tax=Knufia peltigerae TaxID=1002370 RepID=A0AA38YFG0_9EURO|nr:hypothetical protein H2204_000198 [Knufia peltigerae]